MVQPKIKGTAGGGIFRGITSADFRGSDHLSWVGPGQGGPMRPERLENFLAPLEPTREFLSTS